MTVVKRLPDSFRLSFWVRAKDDPEVHQWLTNHPFRSQSAAARALLSVGVSAFATMESMLQQDSAGEKAEPKTTPQKRAVKPLKPRSEVAAVTPIAQNNVAVVSVAERFIPPQAIEHLPGQVEIGSGDSDNEAINEANDALSKLMKQFK